MTENRLIVSGLIAALDDESFWVRTGAAQALSEIGSDDAIEALRAHWGRVDPSSDEQWMLILALERAGIATSGLLAPLTGFPSAATAEESLALPWDDFAILYNRKRKDGILSNTAVRVLEEVWQIHSQRARPEWAAVLNARDLSAAGRLETDIRVHLSTRIANSASPGVSKRAEDLLGPIVIGLRSEAEAEVERAIEQLAEVALTEPDVYIQGVVRMALAISHDASARRILLRAMAGEPPIWPDSEQLRKIIDTHQREYGEFPDLSFESQKMEMATALAMNALEEFYDDDTAYALTELAVAGEMRVRARAELVLAGMRIDASLPALIWAAANASRWDERHRSEGILRNIVGKKRVYGIEIYRVTEGLSGSAQLDADLTWLIEVLERSLTLPSWAGEASKTGSLDWTRNREATQSLLRHSVRSMRHVKGEQKVLFHSLSPWDRFVSGIRQTVGLEATNERGDEAETIFKSPRHTDIEFPSTCVIKQACSLRIGLSISPQATSVVQAEIDVSFARSESFVDLLVLVHSNGFVVSPSSRTLRVPLDKDSEKCEFTLVPRDIGPQIIEVEFLQGVDRVRGVERVGYVCLSPDVLDDGTTEGQATQKVLESVYNQDLLRKGEIRARIDVEWLTTGGLAYSVFESSSTPSELKYIGIAANGLTFQEAKDWVSEQSTIIRDYLKDDYPTEADLDGALASIASIGHALYKQLAPSELGPVLRAWPANSTIAVSTKENWIPWELLSENPGGPILGERFQIVRTPRILDETKSDDLAPQPIPVVETSEVEIHKIASVVGDEIPVGKQIGEFSGRRTFGKALSRVVEVVQGTLVELQKGINDADIVHFTCHGRGSPTYHLSFGPGAGRRLLIPQVAALKLKPGALVFANACSSAGAQLLLREFQSFGWNFYLAGARPFVGTLGPVPTKHAIEFAEHFYRCFIEDGLSTGQAIRQAKIEMQKKHRNPFWLFYCLYGSASVHKRLNPILK